MRNITLKHFELFVTVYENKSQQIAADKLYISRQSISSAIHDMESEFDHRIFIKGSSPLIPTPFGTYLYEKAKKLLDDFNSVIKDCKSFDQLNFSFAINSNLLTVLPKLKVAFLDYLNSHNDITIDIKDNFSQDEILEKINSDQIDCAIILSLGIPNGFYSCELHRTPVNVILRNNHPLADNKELTYEQIINYPLVCFSKLENSYKEMIDKLPKSSDDISAIIEPNVLIASQIMQQNHNAIMPCTDLNYWIPDYPHLKIIPIRDAFWTISIVSKKDSAKLFLYDDFANYIRESW